MSSKKNFSRLVATAAFSVMLATYAGVAPARAACQDDTGAQDSSLRAEMQQATDSYLSARQAVEGFSGLSVYASLAGNGPWLHVTAGSSAMQDGQPICLDTPFEVGSITKSFTAVMILKLEAAGLLDIHDTLGRWLPQYPLWSSITIQQLLNMTAPTDDFLGSSALISAVAADRYQTYTPEQLVSYAYPGGVEAPWQYINTNYILAGMIISKVTGLSYEDALRKLLLDPLQLHQTWYGPEVPPAWLLAAMPAGYDWLLPKDSLYGTNVDTINMSLYGAAGGIIASLPDIDRWVRDLFSGTLLPSKQQSELFAMVSQNSGQPIAVTTMSDPGGYSLGIAQQWFAFMAAPAWWYQGETWGYRVAWFRRPGDGLVVEIAINSANGHDDIAGLYKSVIEVLEPQIIVDPGDDPSTSVTAVLTQPDRSRTGSGD